MKDITITKAGAIGDSAPQDVVIRITGEPNDTMSLKEARAFYEQEAALLFDGIFYALPGGTLDEFLVLLLKKRASLFRVALVEES